MSAKILEIKDNIDGTMILERILKAWGYEVIETTTIETAITLAEENHPDIILVDIFCLPDGVSFPDRVEQIRNNNPFKNNPTVANIPTIVILPRHLSEEQDFILKAGFEGCIVKPMDIDELSNQLNSIIVGRA